MPAKPAAKVDERRISNEKPPSFANSAPHKVCVRSGIEVHPVGRKRPSSSIRLTAIANDQSSFNGKFPAGFTIPIPASQISASRDRWTAVRFKLEPNWKGQSGEDQRIWPPCPGDLPGKFRGGRMPRWMKVP